MFKFEGKSSEALYLLILFKRVAFEFHHIVGLAHSECYLLQNNGVSYGKYFEAARKPLFPYPHRTDRS